MNALQKMGLVLMVCMLFFQATNVSAKDADSPKQVVYQFYKTYQHTNKSGLPTPAGMAALKPFLSAKFFTAIELARNAQAQFILNNPAEKPPLIEGDLFSSLFESFTSYSIGKHKAVHKIHSVKIYFVYTNATEQSVKWRDEATVIKENQRYVIDNIKYSRVGEFNSAGDLMSNLTTNQP